MTGELTTGSVALHNIHAHPARSAALALIAGIAGFSLYSVQTVTASLSNGLSSLHNRLGADLMVVPAGSQQKEESVLLAGTPGTFYMNKDTQNKINHLEGIQSTTSQYFFTSVQASCCSTAVQLIGFDPETDFVITPWITKSITKRLNNGEIVIGSDITPGASKQIMFFGRIYPVASQLGKTGTGMDQSVYMNMETMQQLIQDAANQGISYKATRKSNQVSTVLIRLKSGVNAEKEASLIRKKVPDTDVMISDQLTSRLSDSLSSFISVFRIIEAGIIIIVLLVLIIFYNITFHERRKEFAIYRIFGTSNRVITKIAFTESFFLSIAGAAAGIGISAAVVFPFSRLISQKIQLPYLNAGFLYNLLIAGAVFLITVIIGGVAASCSIQQLKKSEDYFLIRQGE